MENFRKAILSKKELSSLIGGSVTPPSSGSTTIPSSPISDPFNLGSQFTVHAGQVNPNQGLIAPTFLVGGNINFSNNPDSGNLIPHEGSHTAQNSSSSYK